MLAIALLAACARDVPTPPSFHEFPPNEILPPAPAPAPISCDQVVWLEVRKSERQLIAHCQGGATWTLRIALGRTPLGTKLRAGDRRTPEGMYRVIGVRPSSQFHAFIHLDYPSLEDADRAFINGELSPLDYRRIVEAHRRGGLPPSDTPLGGEIGIHGEGDRWAGSTRYLDWTFGCVGMPDRELDFLAARTRPGTPVHILP